MNEEIMSTGEKVMRVLQKINSKSLWVTASPGGHEVANKSQ